MSKNTQASPVVEGNIISPDTSPIHEELSVTEEPFSKEDDQQEQDQDQDQDHDHDHEQDQDQESDSQDDHTSDDEGNLDSGKKDSSGGAKFQEGQLLKLIRVRFPGNAKSFPFLFGKRKFEYGRKVLAMSDRGIAVGYINSFPYEVTFNKSMLPLRTILKLATDQDLIKDTQHFNREQEAKSLCKEMITKHELDMELTHVEYTQFGKKAVFYFTSPARVDFRNLVKDLVTGLKMRIELRQIGWRDRTAALGGIGPCGRQLCCNSFLGKYGNVNLKMAKNQNLTMNPGRLNGVCGQLKCCVQYEDEVYKEKTSRLPPLGKYLLAVNGDKGKVERHHILVEQFEMITDEGKRRRYSINQFDPQLALPSQWRFPTQFEHIINETDNCIGLEKKEVLDKTTQFLKSLVIPSENGEEEEESSSESKTSLLPGEGEGLESGDSLESDSDSDSETDSGSESESGEESPNGIFSGDSGDDEEEDEGEKSNTPSPSGNVREPAPGHRASPPPPSSQNQNRPPRSDQGPPRGDRQGDRSANRNRRHRRGGRRPQQGGSGSQGPQQGRPPSGGPKGPGNKS